MSAERRVKSATTARRPTASRLTTASQRPAVKPAAARKATASGPVKFHAVLRKPRLQAGEAGGWLFLNLPADASAALPSRGMVWVGGKLNGAPLRAPLHPDGRGGHWLRLESDLVSALGVQPGDRVTAAFTPIPPDQAPEYDVPADVQLALEAAPSRARDTWADITPIARRDWIQWITAAKREATRARRIQTACDMLAKGKRRPCCFDRSGKFDGSLSCPAEAE